MAPAPQSPGFTTPEAIFHSFRISFISQTSKHWRHPRFMNSLLFCLHTAYLGDLSGKGGMWSSAQSSAGGGSLGSQTSKRRLSIKPHEKQCSLAVMALTRWKIFLKMVRDLALLFGLAKAPGLLSETDLVFEKPGERKWFWCEHLLLYWFG